MLLHGYQDITNILPHESHYFSDNANSESIVVQLGEGIVMKTYSGVHCVGISHVIDLSINL